MAAEGDLITFIFTGENNDDLPDEDFRVIVHKSVTVIPAEAFYENQNVVELICHEGVERIEGVAFCGCPRLRRLIIPGVEIVWRWAFARCEAITYVECDKLEKIELQAFNDCKSLSNINLPSAKIVETAAFSNCVAMTDVKFGKNLESIEWIAFKNCPSLVRITIPLKSGLITACVFQGCNNLERIDLVEGSILRETIDALQLEEWRNDMHEEIDSINQFLPNTRPGGGKSYVIRVWITVVLRKVIHYKSEHRRFVNEASTILQLVTQRDIVINNVLPFIELPPHAFDGE